MEKFFLKFSLIASLALSNAVNSEILYLSCAVTSTKSSRIDGQGWDWSTPITSDNYAYEFSLDTKANTGSLNKWGEFHKLDEVYVYPTSIVIKFEEPGIQTDKFISYSLHTYQINRNNKTIKKLTRFYRKYINENKATLWSSSQAKGICK